MNIDVSNDEAIFHGNECVGYITSGGFAHWVGKSLALGYVPTPLAGDATELGVEILGERCSAQVTAEPTYDPTGSRMRS